MYENEISTQNVQDIDSIRGHPVANYQRFTETTHGRKQRDKALSQD